MFATKFTITRNTTFLVHTRAKSQLVVNDLQPVRCTRRFIRCNLTMTVTAYDNIYTHATSGGCNHTEYTWQEALASRA